MRTRRWILVIALFIAFTTLVIYHSWNILNVNERIKKYVLSKIEPVLGADFQIKKLEMSLGAVHLKNVVIKNNDFLLQIDNVRIGFNLTNLIKNNFRPQTIPHDILFIKPYLTIQPTLLKALHNSSKDTSHLDLEVSHHQFWEKLKEFDFIKRVTISKGKICFNDSVSHSDILLADDLNGWLSSKDEGIIATRLVGMLFQSGTYNLYINGSVDIGQEHFDVLDVKIKNYAWKDKIPRFIPDYFDIKQGMINGVITVTKNEMKNNGFDIQGEISINDGAMQISDKHLYFDKINIKAKIDDQDCILENSGFMFNGSSIDLTGIIHNYFSLQLDLTLNSDHFDWSKTIDYLATKSSIDVVGNSNLSLHISNSFNNPTVSGQVLSPGLTINGKTFEQLNTIISIEDSVFKIKEFSSRLDSLDLTGHAKLDFTRSPDSLFFSITSRGKISSTFVQLPFPSLENNTGNFQLHGKGDLSRVSGTIDLSLKSLSLLGTTYYFNGDFVFKNDELSIQLNSPSHNFWGQGLINFSGSRPRYEFRLSNAHQILYSLPEFGTFQRIFNYKTSVIHIQNDQSEWIINGRYAWNEPAHWTTNMKCRIKSQQDRKLVETNFDIHSGSKKFVGQLNLVKTIDYWDIINFDIENIFNSNGRIYCGEQKQIEANVIFPGASLPDLGNLVFSPANFIDQGRFYGFIDVSGSLENPRVSGSLDFSELVFNQVGSYSGGLTFQLINNKLVLNDFKIDRNQQSLFTCNGWYSTDSDQLNFDILGHNIDLNAMLTTVINKPGLLEGKGSSRIQLKGSLNRPKIYGKLDIENGKLGPFLFNHFRVDFGEQSQLASAGDNYDADSLMDEGIILKNILVNRAGQFEMQGKGLIPYSSPKSMAVELNGKGNILSLLPDLTPFFKETSSNGEWKINFGGSPQNIEVLGGTLELSGGYLRLGDVAPEINDITASMELEQDGFLNVKFISGKIKGKPFTFQNFRGDSNLALESFAIPEYGLDLGIFTLETTSKGIPLRIPGLMKKREIGYLIFDRKNEAEKFYFAGPLDKPVVRGKVRLQNGNITFPFIKRNSGDSTRTDPVEEVLKQIDWDIAAEAGKDLHYQREFPGGVDNAYLDLIANAGAGGLNFKGVINDSSFGVTGSLESSHGNVEYLDLNFEVIKAGVEFDAEISPESEVVFNKKSLLPIVYGEARTTVMDSTGYPYYIYLTLLTVDKQTGHTMKRGRLGEVKFQLSADNPNLGLGYTEAELLASLGYSSSNIPKMATDLIGISADNLVFRPLFRPVERQLERTFRLDMVRFSSRFTRNLIEMNLYDERNFPLDSKLFLLRSTKLMVGKYLAQKFFLLYTGQLEAGMDYRYQQEGFGFRHTLGLEYRINPSLFLQMQYNYDSLLLWQKEDKRIMLRYSFPF